ncbi:maleylpyruvate isomerase family mycothiol-dependent enzyme [Streptomyces sp. AM 4-1-1]|uniref:maleylpyruvate isomerase family mycothiol-dependent enzyme n=1 Tax=Streptomyces sp. AM 4-1-1 TaxID=3028710 RepID=UPI0023BA1716|nr:maleylpyruvate isomerase family mycothiol-dependent enzyme [Streptomyces sp. AM 4-1-1]WEH36428.1 maleylpyruvate isomerase family mycothiol-dependent enzyme [Streptomyces sp. AM 4-1-1]
MGFPLEQELRAERRRLIVTLDQLSDEAFDSGRTLCSEWSPRDILGHLLSVDGFAATYLPYGPFLQSANRRQVERARRSPRSRLMARARIWAAQPSLTSRVGAVVTLGDLAIHHQDIVRGLGLSRDLPASVPTFILWDGALLSLRTNVRVLRYRVVPTDGYPPIGTRSGCVPEVRGTREALGLWLAGRDSVSDELVFN